MELFRCANLVKLRSGHHDQCLWQDDEHLSVAQKRDQVNPAQVLDKTLVWKVELVNHPGDDDHEVAGNTAPPTIRLQSQNGLYLKASERRFLLGATGRKVTQEAILSRVDASCEWEASEVINDTGGSSTAGGVGDGDDRSRFVKLRSKRYGTFLRANGGLPPYRNTVTHDVPWLGITQDSIIWEVEVVDFRIKKLASSILPPLRIVHVSNLLKFIA